MVIKKMIFDHGHEPQRKLWEKFISFATLTDVEGEEQEISTHKEPYKQIVCYPSFEGLTILFK